MQQAPIAITLLEKREWRKGLVSLRFEKPEGFTFKSGQFVRLGLDLNVEGVSQYVARAYSMASTPEENFLEFFITAVPNGTLSGPLCELQAGHKAYLEPQLWGQMIPERIPATKNLWLLSSGTGLAPFISILKEEQTWKKWPHIILVHSVSYSEDLAYSEQIEKFASYSNYGGAEGRRFSYLPIVTKEATQFLSRRIPLLINDGELTDQAQEPLNSEDSSVMICGNPQMVKDVRALLKPLGFKAPRQASAGNLLAENLW